MKRYNFLQLTTALAGSAFLPKLKYKSRNSLQANIEQPRGYNIPLVDLAGETDRQVIVDREEGQYLGHPTTVLLDDRKTMIAVYPKGHGGGSIVMKKSIDGGVSWTDPVVVATHPQADLCEPGVLRSPDGDQIAMLLRENSRQFNSHITFSDDEGTTWSDPVELPGALTGDRHQAIYTHDGRLFISFRDTTHISPTKGDWVAWVGTYDDIVNPRREGQYRVRLMDNTYSADCAYPAVELLPEGTIVATTYGHWTKDEEPYIVSVRLTMDELDQRA